DSQKRSAQIRSGTEEGAFLLTYTQGEGRITILASANFLTNRQIGRYDHARLAWHLLRSDPGVQKVTLVFRPDEPSLASLLVRHGWTALLPGLLLLAAALWRAGARLG